MKLYMYAFEMDLAFRAAMTCMLAFIDRDVISVDIASIIQDLVDKLNIILVITLMHGVFFMLKRCEIQVNPKYETPT